MALADAGGTGTASPFFSAEWAHKSNNAQVITMGAWVIEPERSSPKVARIKAFEAAGR